MFLKETERRQKKLNRLLRCMAEKLYDEDSDELREALLSLQEIYSKNIKNYEFRHNYSEFFPLVSDISKGNKDKVEYLLYNLNLIRDCVEESYASLKNLFIPLHKLYDHLDLEISRLKHSTSNMQKLEMLETQLTDAKEELQSTKEDLNDATKKLEDAQSIKSEMIAVLSIFAAVIIGFFGGMNYISSAIASIQKVHIYKSAAIVLIAGIILFNVIFSLMYFISKIIDRNIYAVCKTKDCSCNKKCKPIIRVAKRTPYIFWINILLVLLWIITCVIWLYVGAPI